MSTRSPPRRRPDPYASDPARPATSALQPWWRWLFAAAGLGAVGYGVYGLLTAGSRVPLRSWLTWFVGSALLNDLVIAPLWIGLGWLATGAARGRATGGRGGVAVAGLLALIALPFVLGAGRTRRTRRSCRATTAGTAAGRRRRAGGGRRLGAPWRPSAPVRRLRLAAEPRRVRLDDLRSHGLGTVGAWCAAPAGRPGLDVGQALLQLPEPLRGRTVGREPGRRSRRAPPTVRSRAWRRRRAAAGRCRRRCPPARGSRCSRPSSACADTRTPRPCPRRSQAHCPCRGSGITVMGSGWRSAVRVSRRSGACVRAARRLGARRREPGAGSPWAAGRSRRALVAGAAAAAAPPG